MSDEAGHSTVWAPETQESTAQLGKSRAGCWPEL